ETVRPEESRKVEGRRRRPVGLAEHDITLTEATDLPLKSWGSMPSSRKPLTPSRVERSRAGVPDQSALPKMPTIKAAAPSPRLVTPMATALPTLGDANESPTHYIKKTKSPLLKSVLAASSPTCTALPLPAPSAS